MFVLVMVLAGAESAAAQAVPAYWNNATGTRGFTTKNLMTKSNSYYVSLANKTQTYEWFNASQIYADAALVRYGGTTYTTGMNNSYSFMGKLWNTNSATGGYFAASGTSGTGVARDRIYTDDNALTGVAYLDAYDAISDPTMKTNYLNSAKAIANWLMNGGIWDSAGGGGFWWNTVDRWKPTQSNGLAIQLFLRLYQKTGQTMYLNWANSTKAFLDAQLYDNTDGLYGWQTNYSKTRKFTYDQAIMIEVNLLYREVTGQSTYLTAAQSIATNMHTKLWNTTGGYRIRTDSVDGGWRLSPTYGGWASQSLARLYAVDGNRTWLDRARANVDVLNLYLRQSNGSYYASCEPNGTGVTTGVQTVDQAWMQRVQAILAQYP